MIKKCAMLLCLFFTASCSTPKFISDHNSQNSQPFLNSFSAQQAVDMNQSAAASAAAAAAAQQQMMMIPPSMP